MSQLLPTYIIHQICIICYLVVVERLRESLFFDPMSDVVDGYIPQDELDAFAH